MDGVNSDLIGRGRLFLGMRLRDQASLFGWVGGSHKSRQSRSFPKGSRLKSGLAGCLTERASFAVGESRTLAAFRSFPSLRLRQRSKRGNERQRLSDGPPEADLRRDRNYERGALPFGILRGGDGRSASRQGGILIA